VGPRNHVLDKGSDPPRGIFGDCPAHWKAFWVTAVMYVRSEKSVRLLQPTALLPTGRCHINCSPMKNSLLQCGLPSKFSDHLLWSLSSLLCAVCWSHVKWLIFCFVCCCRHVSCCRRWTRLRHTTTCMPLLGDSRSVLVDFVSLRSFFHYLFSLSVLNCNSAGFKSFYRCLV